MPQFFVSAGRFMISHAPAFLIYALAVNLTAFILYGADKKKAEKHKWRIPEATLILFAGIGGAVGALLGMYLFRHKTKHIKFLVTVPLFTVLWCAFVGICVFAAILA